MFRTQRTFRLPSLALALIAGCAGQDIEETDPTIDDATLWVSAQPRGHVFDDSLTIRLLSERPSKLFYTIDGSPPTGADAIEYTEPLVFDDDVLLMFVAVDQAGIWSKPQREVYEKDFFVAPEPLARSLWYDRTILFFAPGPMDPYIDQELVIESTGSEPVRISEVLLGPNPDGKSFWSPTAFEIMTPVDDVLNLRPNEKLHITIRYHTTETIRSAAVVVRSNDERVRNGEGLIPLWGRLEQ